MTLAAYATGAPPAPTDTATPILLIGPGLANVLDPHKVLFGFVDLRTSLRLHGVGLWASVEGTHHERFLGVGAFYDIALGKRWVLTPSFGPGFYSEHGGVILGFPLEFRSTIELSRELPTGVRVGASFGHISNAGFGHTNPGSETVKVFYAFPL